MAMHIHEPRREDLSRSLTAVQKASLGDTLNSTPNITVLAPADPAFTAIPGDELTALLDDTPRLTAVLTQQDLDRTLRSNSQPSAL